MYGICVATWENPSHSEDIFLLYISSYRIFVTVEAKNAWFCGDFLMQFAEFCSAFLQKTIQLAKLRLHEIVLHGLSRQCLSVNETFWLHSC